MVREKENREVEWGQVVRMRDYLLGRIDYTIGCIEACESNGNSIAEEYYRGKLEAFKSAYNEFLRIIPVYNCDYIDCSGMLIWGNQAGGGLSYKCNACGRISSKESIEGVE